VEEEEIQREVRAQFTPEFLNRVDEIVVFKSLAPEHLRRIVDLQLQDLRNRLRHQGKVLLLEPAAQDYLARDGYSFEYGARNLGRTLRRHLSEPLAQLALRPEWEAALGVRVLSRGEGVDLVLITPDSDILIESEAGEKDRAGELGSWGAGEKK
jgi:ATP-dependent Clp protease ATP-binding subunit ClpC